MISIRKTAIGLLIVLEIILILLIPTQVSAPVSNATVTANNLAPGVKSISCNTVLLTGTAANSTYTFYCWITVNDSNGYQNIDELNTGTYPRRLQSELLNKTAAWDPSIATVANPIPNTRIRYYNNSCKKITGSPSFPCSGYDCSYNCTFIIWYNVYGSPVAQEAWQVVINVTDEVGNWTWGERNYSLNIPELKAYDYSGEGGNMITFGDSVGGPITPGNPSAEQITPFWNTGNVELDAQVNATYPGDFVCEYGSIGRSNITYNVSSVSPASWDMNAKVTADRAQTHPILYNNFDLLPSTDYNPADWIVPSSKNIYWILYVPTGVGGTCWTGIEVSYR